MSRRKIPQDAFMFYMSLGPARSYQKVAEQYGVSKRAVVSLATSESWQERVDELERKARQQADEKALESLNGMNERHLKLLRAMQAKALEALKQFRLDTALAAVKTLESTIRQERRIRGEPQDGTATSVEDVIKREYERWMVVEDEESDLPDEDRVTDGNGDEVDHAGRGGSA